MDKLSDTLELPEILNIPDKLLPVITRFNQFRYFLIDGGRGGAKSQSVARLLTYIAEQMPIRIVCGREFQNSIEESVYTIFKDLISEHSLNFEVLSTKIIHRKSGTSMIFRGFREQGSTNIKGLEGVHVLWIDESQVISKQTLDVIIPTIRKENAKVIFTMNRHVENDPVYEEFINRLDCLHIKLNYTDNEHCPKALIHEAEVCKLKSITDYNHIWLGEPLPKGSQYLFSLDMIRRSLSLDLNRIGVQRRVLANDVARYGDCENVFTVIESRGPIFWQQIHQECFKNWGLDETVGKHLSLKRTMNIDLNVVDDDGLGGGVTDNLRGIEVAAFKAVKDYTDELYENRKTAAYFKLQDWLERGWLKILNDPVLHKQLQEVKYKYSEASGKKMIIPKTEKDPETGKLVQKFWDRSDALMMAVWHSDDVMHGDFGTPAYAIHGNPSLELETIGMQKYAKIS